ncbi:AlpA family transcriptional regulator [Chryseobacterium sp. GVT01B]|uniref:helix-turn-helix transcriptional regulator n=1 Tax=Chryseobacterium sp. GVT01B TaxID=2862675 RepID=UPI001CBC0AAC|nr:helix-turn-helix domain-containing protein [Chryseobacterium sp. GVT01B]
MSSNIEIIRICQYCGKEFIAKTTVTKYCSHTCNKKAYKAELKTKKIEKSNINTQLFKESYMDIINSSAFLTVKESACLLKCSKQMIYDLVNSGRLKSIKLSVRNTRISRIEIDNLFKISIRKVKEN